MEDRIKELELEIERQKTKARMYKSVAETNLTTVRDLAGAIRGMMPSAGTIADAALAFNDDQFERIKNI